MVHIVCRQLERVRGACWRVDGLLTRADAASLQLVCRPFAHECALGRPSCKGRDKLQVLARQAWEAFEGEPGCCGGGDDDGTISLWHCRLRTELAQAEK